MSDGYDFGSFKNDAMDRPSSKAWSNWAKFEKVGDMVQGYIVDVFFRKSEGQYKAARGITLKQENGELINVSIKRHDFILEKTDKLRLGDPLTVVLEAELPARVKGYSPTKQFGFYGKNIEASEGNKTVRQLETEDMKAGGMDEEMAAEQARLDKEFEDAPKDVTPAATAAAPQE